MNDFKVCEYFSDFRFLDRIFLWFVLAMKLMTGLVDVAMAVSVQLQTTQRRYDIENSKSPRDPESTRLEELKTAIREVKHSNTDLAVEGDIVRL